MRVRIVPQGAVIFPGEPGGSGKYKKMDKYIEIKKVQAHREQTWRKQRRSGGEAHLMAGSGTQRFFPIQCIVFLFSVLYQSTVDTFDNPGCQLVPWYVVATIFAKIHRARALDLHCSLLHLATCVQVVY